VRIETTAWVESPLQLLGALEHAALERAAFRGTDGLTIIPRSGDAQLEHAATQLAERAARDGEVKARIMLDRRVMPWGVFATGTPWLVGDAYSGQVQARLDRAEPSVLTLVDDGAITRLLAEQLNAGAPLMRPRAPRLMRTMRRELAARTTRRLLALAAEGRLAVTTFLPQSDPAVTRLSVLGAIVTTHRFDFTRRWGERAVAVPADARIVLGTARVADGLEDPSVALERIVRLARSAAVAYLPHRREPAWFLRAAGRLRDVVVVAPRHPVELALAGTARPLDVVTSVSTASETLPIVLRNTGSTIRLEPVGQGVGS